MNDETWGTVENAVQNIAQFLPDTKAKTILLASLTGASIFRVAQSKLTERAEQKNYSIHIKNNPTLETIIDTWIIDSQGPDNLRALSVGIKEQGRARQPSPVSGSYVPNPEEDYLFKSTAEEDRGFSIFVAGHHATVKKTQLLKSGAKTNDPNSREGGGVFTIETVIFCKTPEGRNAVIDALNKEVAKMNGGPPMKHVSGHYGDFYPAGYVTPRPIESVILADGQKEHLIAEILEFYDKEEQYRKYGIPHHHGILLYGPPGTGKTSVISALATHLAMSVYTINLGSVGDDDNLAELARSVPPGSIILLEDIDIFHAVKNRTDTNGGLTMTGVLNVLDGLLTPNGTVIIITSNNIDDIDPAILRPGRVDTKLHIDYLDQRHLEELCVYFLGHVPEDLPNISKDDMIVPADIVGCAKIYLTDMAKMEQEIIEEIWRKKNAKVSTTLPLQRHRTAVSE